VKNQSNPGHFITHTTSATKASTGKFGLIFAFEQLFEKILSVNCSLDVEATRVKTSLSW